MNKKRGFDRLLLVILLLTLTQLFKIHDMLFHAFHNILYIRQK